VRFADLEAVMRTCVKVLARCALTVALGCAGGAMVAGDTAVNHGPWGDQGDGTFRNPVLAGDFSDPDVIRVGDEYVLITSTFQYSPGMAVLVSKDLVNWRYAGHCVADMTQVGPELNWDRMNRYNRGMYAGAIRYHAGKYWVFFTTMDEGIFMTTSEKPEGPWAPLTRVSETKNCDDPCPIWTDDGKAYILLSHPGKEWWTWIYPMAPDGTSIDEKNGKIIDNKRGSEGNKIYKFGDSYYIFHNQIDGGANRTGVWMRSREIMGPYDEKVLFLQGVGKEREREPNQGGLIDTPDGRWFFMTHQGRGGFYDGRPVSLLPVEWKDGWPVVVGGGKTDGQPYAGGMVWSGEIPIKGVQAEPMQASDEFSDGALGPQWEWNYQPRAEKWSLSERPGWLRLKAFAPLAKGDLRKAGNTLTQRVMGYLGGVATVKMDVSAMSDGGQAGLAHFSAAWCTIGVEQTGGKRRVVYRERQFEVDPETKKNRAKLVETAGPEVTGAEVYFRSVMDEHGLAQAQYSLDGTSYVDLGGKYVMHWADYRGDRLGIYCFNDLGDGGQVDVDWFHYAYSGRAK
jgi:beta-xylosidase